MIAPFSGLFFYFGGESTSMVVFTWIVSLLASASTGTSLMLGLSGSFEKKSYEKTITFTPALMHL